MVEVRVREHERINGLCVVGKRSIDALFAEVRALFNAAINENFPLFRRKLKN